jgi:hypothetical protein
MRNKILLRAAFIIFAATIFFHPAKHLSHASVLAQLAETEQEPESTEITGEQQDPDVLPEQEEQLLEEAEDPQGPYEEYVPEPGDEGNQPQEPSKEYVPEPGDEENLPQEPSEEYVPEPGDEGNQPQEPSEEYAPEQGDDEEQQPEAAESEN